MSLRTSFEEISSYNPNVIHLEECHCLWLTMQMEYLALVALPVGGVGDP